MTTESQQYAYGPAIAALQARRAQSIADRTDAFRIPGPYTLTGPLPSKARPDVWAVYKAATAARFEVEFVPGLVLRLGQGQIFMDYYVTFEHRYHHRFHEASSANMLFTNLAEFVAWLAEHPHPKTPYLR